MAYEETSLFSWLLYWTLLIIFGLNKLFHLLTVNILYFDLFVFHFYCVMCSYI